MKKPLVALLATITLHSGSEAKDRIPADEAFISENQASLPIGGTNIYNPNCGVMQSPLTQDQLDQWPDNPWSIVPPSPPVESCDGEKAEDTSS